MVTSSWFVNATEARNNIVKDIAVHSEICAIEREILLAVQRGDYEVTVSNASVFTHASAAQTQVFSVDSVTNILTVSNHGLITGQTVTVSSTVSLPPPLQAGVYYYVIFVDADHIKLAASLMHARAGQSISIDITQGVTDVTVTVSGSGYQQPPVVSFVGGNPESSATARAVLMSQGSVASVSLLSPSSGFVSQPSVNIISAGEGAQAGVISFETVSASVAVGGNNYNVLDLLYVLTGVGTPTVLRVTAVSGGSVTAVSVVTAGSYTELPDLVASITSTDAQGGGCSVNLVMGVHAIAVQSPGLGYVQPPQVIITGGGGSGASAVATLAGGTVAGFLIVQRGTGYTGAPDVLVTSGSGAVAVAQLEPTVVDQITVMDDGGASYVNPPAVSVLVTQGTGAVAGTVTVKVMHAEIRNPGVAYTLGDTLLVSGGVATHSCTVQVTAINADGQIQQINIIAGGSYTVLPELAASSVLGGTGAGASVDLTMGLNTISVSMGGSGYTTPPAVIITGVSMTPATAFATINAGVVDTVTVSHTGSGYTAIPTVLITLGSGATAEAELVPSTVQSIQVIDGGSDYTVVPQVTITGGGGSGATAVAVLVDNSVAEVTVTNAGSGYTSTPNISIEGSAQLTVSIVPVPVRVITVTNAGSNYIVQPTVTVDGAATAVPTLAATGIAAVRVIQPGINYTANPSMEFLSGTAQVTNPVLPITQVNRSFGVQSVVVTNIGTAYTSVPSVQLSAPQQSGTPAQATAQLGSGTGMLGLQQFTASRDYWRVWQQCAPSNPMLVRPFTDQMNSVIKYFDDLGYSITRSTNPTTGNTLVWTIRW